MEPARDTVLIIGGTGFLGSHIVDAFVTGNCFRIVSVSRDPTASNNINPGADYVACDTTKYAEVAVVIKKIQPVAIIHTSTPGPFAPAKLHDKEFAALQNLIRMSSEASAVKAFIYVGSTEAFENVSGLIHTPMKEEEAILFTTRTAPSPYALSKARAEQFVLKANGPSLATVVLRLPGIYGPRDLSITLPLLRMANTLATRVQLGHNKAVHDWIYAESAAHACVLAASALLHGDEARRKAVTGEAFFITDGAPVKFWNFARILWTEAGDTSQPRMVILWWVMVGLALSSEALCQIFTFGQKTPAFSRLHIRYMKDGGWFCIEKAQQVLGYQPVVQTDEGVRRTVAWFQESGMLNRGK